MSTLISFDEFGKIIGRTVGPPKVLQDAASESEFCLLANGISATEDTHYVQDGVLVEKPERPSLEHTFDYTTKTWVYDLTRHRDEKWREIRSERDREEFSTFEWGGYVFQCDEVSQRRLQGAVQLATIDSSISLDWTLADNSVATLSGTDFVAVGQALAAHVNACHIKGRGKRAAIDAATTQAELDAITW